MKSTHAAESVQGRIMAIPPQRLKPNPFSVSIYGNAQHQNADLLASIREQGILVPLVVLKHGTGSAYEIVSGHRRYACALTLNLESIPCQILEVRSRTVVQELVIAYNQQRNKVFSQLMREADALEDLWSSAAKRRRMSALGHERNDSTNLPVRRNSDEREASANFSSGYEAVAGMDPGLGPGEGRRGRTDTAIAQYLGMGQKDRYRQARTIWKKACEGDVRAQSAVAELDAGTKTIHAAYKDLRRRTRYAAGFRPTPYDIWAFRHDRAFGIPYPGSIPPGIVAHALHYFTNPGALVVDPMAGGGTTIDVCETMGRTCLAYDVHPSRPDIQQHDIRHGLPAETKDCDLIFCDPPYHTMLASQYGSGVATCSLPDWIRFLHQLAATAYLRLKTGGHFALLLAPQTEKDLPTGLGYLDHAFFGYQAGVRAGFLPLRRISCPMSSNYTPQQVRRARLEGRLLGQVRDLLIFQKGEQRVDPKQGELLFSQSR